jgi:hypothetical protein
LPADQAAATSIGPEDVTLGVNSLVRAAMLTSLGVDDKAESYAAARGGVRHGEDGVVTKSAGSVKYSTSILKGLVSWPLLFVKVRR